VLYVGGSCFDGSENHYLAMSAIALAHTEQDWITLCYHQAGHTPPPEILALSFGWLESLLADATLSTEGGKS
jgi:hypothetical protein